MLCGKRPRAGIDFAVSLGWLSQGDELIGAVANQVPSSHFFKRIPEKRPIFGVVITQKGFVQLALLEFVHHGDLSALATDAFKRVTLAVIHGRRRGHG